MPNNPIIIENSTLPSLSNLSFLTLDQRRKLSQQLKQITPNLSRFNVTGSFNPTFVRVNVEICYGKFDALNQTFEYQEDRGGSGEVRMETYNGPVPSSGFYLCDQEISNLLNLLRIVEENSHSENTNIAAETLELIKTINAILKVFVSHRDNRLKEMYKTRFSNFFIRVSSAVALVFLIIGLPCLMCGYDDSTGFIGPAYFTTTGTVLSVSTSDDYNNDNHATVHHEDSIQFAYDGHYNGTTQNGQVSYIGGIICNTFSATSAPYNFNPGQTHEIAVRRSDKYSCDTVEDLVPTFYAGLVFLSLCGLVIVTLLVNCSLAMRMKEPEYVLE
jgi:hypothetical protein